MSKPKVYVSRVIAEKGLNLLREATELNVWQERELMPRETQFQLFADCDAARFGAAPAGRDTERKLAGAETTLRDLEKRYPQ